VGRRKIVTVLLTAVLTIPIVGVGLWSIFRTMADLADPCASWVSDSSRTGQLSASIAPNDPCRSKTVHGQSKEQAAISAAVVPGGLLIAAMLALAGAISSCRQMMLAGAIGILAETLLVFSLAPLTLVAGLGVLYLASRVQPGGASCRSARIKTYVRIVPSGRIVANAETGRSGAGRNYTLLPPSVCSSQTR
jgi:hypothetical protein